MSNILVRNQPGSFLPGEYVKNKAESRGNVIALSMFAVVLAGVLGAFVMTNKQWKRVRDEQVTVNEQYVQEGKKLDQLKQLEEQRSQIMEKAEITAALLEKVPRWALLAEVTMRMPTERRMTLTGLDLKSRRLEAPAPAGPAPAVKSLTDSSKGKDGKSDKPAVQAPRFEYTLKLNGFAEVNNDIADFLASLKQSPALDKVELAFIEEAKHNNEDLRKFEMTATVRTTAGPQVLADSLSKLLSRQTNDYARKAGQPALIPPGGSMSHVSTDRPNTPGE
jgi:Tfp pilus assembly protein PilN